MRRARGVLRDERGVILPIVALSMVALIGATSLTLDIGRLANRQRELQAIADVVALDAAGALVGADLQSLVAGDFDDRLVESVERNGVRLDGPPVPGRVTTSASDFVPSSDPADVNAWRLDGTDDTSLVAVAGALDAAGVFAPMAPPGTTVGAVAVFAEDEIEYVFGVGRAITDRSGIAEALAVSGIGMWASLASIDTAPEELRLGWLLSRLLDVEASLVSPDGIAGASISLRKLAAELELGSIDELLTSQVSLRKLLVAEAAVLTADGDTATADVLEAIAADVDGTTDLRLGDIITIEQYGGAAAASAGLDALGLLAATAMLVASDPPHAIALDAALFGMPVSLTVIEPPTFAFGPEGTTVETAQISLVFDRVLSLDTGPLSQEQCLVTAPLLPCVPTLVSVLQLTGTGTSTVTVDVAGGTTVLDHLTCNPAGNTAALDVTTSAVSIDAPLSIPLTATGILGSVAGGTVSLAVASDSFGSTADDVPFGPTANPFDVPFHVPGGTSLAVIDASGAQIDLSAAVLGVSLTGTTATSAVSSALTSQVLSPLNTAVADLLSRLDVLGLGIGGADVVAVAPHCDIARLVA